MRIILTSHGSTGDIYPVIALGVALQRRGHQVKFATVPHFRGEIEAAGIEFYPLCPEDRQPDLAFWMGRLNQLGNPLRQLREIYVGAKDYIPEMVARMSALMPDTDLLVASYLFPMLKGLADRHHVPFATLAFTPHIIPSPDITPHPFPSLRRLGRSANRAWNRGLWRLADMLVDRTVDSAIAAELHAVGLPRVRRFFGAAADRVLVTVPGRYFLPHKAELHDRFRYVGYLRWQATEEPGLDKELRAFVHDVPGGKVPVLTFGSMVHRHSRQWMERFFRAWPRDRKIIVQRGWAQLPELDAEPHIQVVGKVSHDQLFRFASAVVHHGGAGTTASALHAGVPQIVVPHIGDQHFFARDVERLGCGLRLKKSLWPERLHVALARLLADSARIRRADEIGRDLRTDNGPEQAAIELETFAAGHGRA